MGAEPVVGVRDEPRHRRRFANAYTWVYDVLIPPADTTLFHHHDRDTFYVAVESATVRTQLLGEEESEPTEVTVGRSLCSANASDPWTHRVSNVGASPMRMIGAEVLAQPRVVEDDALDAPAHRLIWEASRLRAYEIHLAPGESTGRVDYGFSGLTVALTQANLIFQDRGSLERTVALARGDVVWHEGPGSTSITNAGTDDYRAILGEWR
jgi:hypothetical protein